MKDAPAGAGPNATLDLVTMQVNSQLFGIAVRHVHDVLGPQKITRVPLAPGAVAGSLNLRGRIVTVLDLRVTLGIGHAQRAPEAMSMPAMSMHATNMPAVNMPATKIAAMNVVIELDGELYAVLVDNVGDVMTLPAAAVEPLPPTLGASWRALGHGIVRLDDRLLLLLAPEHMLAAAATACVQHQVAA